MNCKAIRHTLFVAGMVFVSNTFAGTEVIKCTDQSGHVTLTDQPCKGEAAQVVLSAATAPAAAADEAAPAASGGTDRYQLTNLPPSSRMRAAPFTQVQAPGRSLARDVATLKEARRTLMLLDSSMAASRQRGFAANP
ncbi:DUF4124 domain-containing protein [Massilia sp. GCM10020059]|uniref:DUF4124 domain-containing protein n=1 Tax=Massilia agrisoli TaxID=2892444 RepID=A0ABS8IQS4_9BURK|nr:DUF4124 domain-containing protein [Massilia agrisoli]MCC6070899.1 DUF4124 domain-containing protein [Massilia agrisoli]